MADKLPFRFRILHYISTVDKACAEDVMKALAPEYGTESQFSKASVEDHLLSMKANYVIDDKDALLNEAGELVLYYAINDEGSKLLRTYLPKSWRQ